MASSMHVHLFVEILNQYLYFFETDNQMVRRLPSTDRSSHVPFSHRPPYPLAPSSPTTCSMPSAAEYDFLDDSVILSRSSLPAALSSIPRPQITEKYISGLIALIQEHIENMDASDQRSEVEAHYRATLAHIRGMQQNPKTSEKFAPIVVNPRAAQS